MVREFKKIGAAAAVAGALLASGSSYATVQLSEPGDAILVPYVVCNPASNNQNTLVGLITFAKERLGLYANGVYYPAPWSLATFTVGGLVPSTPGSASLPARKTGAGPYTKSIHWYFYDTKSVHRLDGVIPATDNDFVRFDWCSTIRATGQTVLNGVNGYMIFTSDEVDRALDLTSTSAVPTFALYGHAYQIQGNWQSQAFIPILPNPIWSINPDFSVNANNLAKRAGYPAFTRLLSGTDFTHLRDTNALRRDVYMRYFLDPALATENRMVFWFNFNAGNYNQAQAQALGYSNTASLSQSRFSAGETYDSEQVYKNSFSWDFPDELNIVTSTPSAPAFPGMLHSEVEAYSGRTVVNTGIVRFGIPEALAISASPAGVNSNIPFVSSGVSFNMLGLGASGANSVQLQTEMSTQGPAY
jgi:hypothetical protein